MPELFSGFALPTSNTTYTPNQFFDVCLPHRSRGCVRLVAYMVRKTLGWCDQHGNPQAEQHVVSYSELEDKAGISRQMIRSAIDEAIANGFIRCARTPQSNGRGRAGISGLYELRWDEGSEYVKDPTLFQGFFAGEGNRTYIPNQFFDHVVPQETLAVVKVVGSVIRLSIGFANKWGHRRRNVALSYQHIRNYARLRDRSSLSLAIDHAIRSNYIDRVEKGFFDPNAGKLSKAAVYALKWLSEAPAELIGQKTRPAETARTNRSETQTGNGQKTRPADRSENPTDIEIKQSNNTSKQQAKEAIAATLERLRGEGFDVKSAQAIASRYPAERVERQIAWIDRRKVRSNRLGMLRVAIANDWPEPAPELSARRPEEGAVGTSQLRPAGTTYVDALEQARSRLAGRVEGPKPSLPTMPTS